MVIWELFLRIVSLVTSEIAFGEVILQSHGYMGVIFTWKSQSFRITFADIPDNCNPIFLWESLLPRVKGDKLAEAEELLIAIPFSYGSHCYERDSEFLDKVVPDEIAIPFSYGSHCYLAYVQSVMQR